MRSIQRLQAWLLRWSRDFITWSSDGSSSRMLQKVIECAPVPICVVDERKELVVSTNHAFRALPVANAQSVERLSQRCLQQLRAPATRRSFDLGRVCHLLDWNGSTKGAHATGTEMAWLAWRAPPCGSERIVLLGYPQPDCSPQYAELARISAAMRAKDDYLAELAHELRGPLAPIEMATMVLRSPHPEKHDRALTALERQTQHMKRLVDDLSELTRAGRTGLSLKLEQVELAVAIERAVELASPVVNGRQHRIVVDVPRGLVVEADLVRLVQVFSNLIINAAKYTHDAGTIKVTAGPLERQVRVRITDNGIGIAEEVLPRIFELFVRSPRARQSEGSGVGLYLVRALVEQHGGTVAAHSDGPGSGSEFTVSLPLMQPRGNVQAQACR